MSSSPLRNFHLPLPSDTYDRLKEEAARQDKSATSVARDAIEDWLRERKKQVVREEIAAYASKMAGGRADLDPELEQAGIDHLRGDGER